VCEGSRSKWVGKDQDEDGIDRKEGRVKKGRRGEGEEKKKKNFQLHPSGRSFLRFWKSIGIGSYITLHSSPLFGSSGVS
jgi:hypothetical protein